MSRSVWQALRELECWRVLEIPRPPEHPQQSSGDGADLAAAQRLAALVSAYHSGTGPLALGLLRLAPGGPVQLLAGGAGLAGGTSPAGGTVLSLPAGARGMPLPAGGMASVFALMPWWTRIAGLAEGLLGQDRPRQPTLQRFRPSLEDGLLAVWPEAFGWLVLAEPAGPGLLDQAAAEAGARLGDALSYAAQAPRMAVQARRLEVRHCELRQAAATGMWRVHLLAGGISSPAAAQVAGMVCASADLVDLPYALIPVRGPARRLEELLASVAAVPPERHPLPGQEEPRVTRTADGGQCAAKALEAEEAVGIKHPRERGASPALAPFYGSAQLLAAVARPPAREVAGLRFALRPEFDVTPENPEPANPGSVPAGEAGGGLLLGEVLDRQKMPAGPLSVPLASMNRHTFVCGATGAGKSQTIRNLLEQATRAGLPWLVVEPAKAEYQLMAARLPGTAVIRIRPSDPGAIPAGINPLEPAPGPGGARFPVQVHADLLRALFLAAFEAEEPFPQVLAAALTRCYEQAGWDLALGEPAAPGVAPGWPSLGDLQAAAEQVVSEIGYGQEITDNVRGFIKVRISSLRLGTTGRFFEGGHPLDFARLLDRNVVLEIEDTGDDQDKAFLMGAVLIRLAEHLRMRHRGEGPKAPGLRHLTVVEEAHRLLRNRDPGQRGAAGQAVDMFAGLLAEIRAYGEGLVIAEQIPAKLIPDVIKNTAVKIVHRLPADDDRAAVGATMNLTTGQSQFLVTLLPGEAAVFTDGMDYPLLARMPDGTARELATPAECSTPASVLNRRANTCGPACQAVPCTLRDMRAAQRALDAEPGITVWAEYSVLGHLTGWHMPVPAAPLRAALAALPARLRDCALSHAADAAAASRAPAICSRLSPPALAAHVTTAMRAGLDEGGWVCDPAEPQWLAPAYQWAIVLDELTARHASGGGSGPHPDTARWQHVYGRPIPGESCAAQRHIVQAWHDDACRDAKQRIAVAFGIRVPSAIEQALGSHRGATDWDQQVARSLDYFNDCPWPLNYLTTTAARQAP